MASIINLTYDAESKLTSGKRIFGNRFRLKNISSFSNGDKIENPNFKKTEKKLKKKLHRIYQRNKKALRTEIKLELD